MEQLAPSDLLRAGAGAPGFRVLDVRAPVEVARGAVPHSVNVPILDDEERRLVGIEYRRAGQESAVALGFELTSGRMAARVASWQRVVAQGPTAVMCWRGGMRSELAQRFLGMPDVPRVRGGYKSLRAELLTSAERSLARKRLLVIGGMTGTGKTDLLRSLAGDPACLALDLEELARHRGSAFGFVEEQPAQQTFENALAAELVLAATGTVLVEDESRHIGRRQVPGFLFERMAAAPLLLLEAPWQERIERIHAQYVLEPAMRYGPAAAFEQLAANTRRLRRRLGGGLVDELTAILATAQQADEWTNPAVLEPFIGPLLQQYYDPLYRRSVATAGDRIVVRGDREELATWLTAAP